MNKPMRIFALSATFLLTTNVHASVVQFLMGINYFNPAMLNSIKNKEFMLGGDYVNGEFIFNGSSPLGTGTVKSEKGNLLPYGRIAVRAHPKVVVGVSVTEPYFANLEWGPDSILRQTSVHTAVRSVRADPQVSLQVTDRLTLGIGAQATHFYGGHFDFAVPGLGTINNLNSGDHYGYSVGLFYVLTPDTFFDAAFHSNGGGVITNTGTSTSESGAINNNFEFGNADPSLGYIELIHKFSPKFLLAGKVFYTNWSSLKNFTLDNTVLPVPLVFKSDFKDTWSFSAGGKYDFNETISGIFGGIYETNFAQAPLNSVGYPGSNGLGLGAGTIVNFTKEFSAQLLYQHYMYLPKAEINNISTLDVGTASLNANIIGLRLTYSA
jgi:long-chain fatty acid transport protein